MKQKIIILLALLAVCIPALSQIHTYPQISTNQIGDRFMFARSNSPSSFSTRNITFTDFVGQLSLSASQIGSGTLSMARGGTGAGLADPNANRILGWDDTDGSIKFLTLSGATYDAGTDTWTITGTVSDGDKGNITVSGGGSVWTIDSDFTLDNVARTTVRKNTGADVGSRRRFNLIEGSNVTLTVTDDAANEEVDITVAATGAGGTPLYVNGTAASGEAALTNTVASGTVTPVTFSISPNTSPVQDLITAAIGNASASAAGAVTTGAQSFGGLKAFEGGISITNAEAFFSGPINRAYETISASDVDTATGNKFTKTLASNLTLTWSNLADGRDWEIRFVQDATGGRTVTIPSSTHENGTNQTAITSLPVNTNANAITTFFFKRIGGATYVEGPSGAASKGLEDFATQTMTSAQFFSHITGETGSGAVVGATLPTFDQGSTAAGAIRLAEDSDNGSNYVELKPSDTLSGNFTVTLPSATDTLVGKATTDDLTNKTIDADGTGNVLKWKEYKEFVFPAFVDGAGATIVTNSYADTKWGLGSFSGSAETNANYMWFRLGTVPRNIDTGVTMTIRDLAVRVSGTDADQMTLDFGYFQPADSTAFAPTAWSSFSGYIRANLTPSAITADDVFYFSDITLTSWAGSMTAGRALYLGIARVNNTNDDTVTVVSGTVEYGSTR